MIRLQSMITVSLLGIAIAVPASAQQNLDPVGDNGAANAVACARGVYRAGCAGYRGAVVVRHTGRIP